MPFELKDGITLSISLAAFGLSSLSFFQKRAESIQNLRKRLTEILKELSELTLKDATFRSLQNKDSYPPNYVGLLSDQRRFFVREAATLAETAGIDVSAHEKNLIAMTFDSIDFAEDAEHFFKSATEGDSSQIDRGLSWRNYGRFLYQQGSFDEGAKAFENAIEAFTTDDERSRYYRVTTYTRWAEATKATTGNWAARKQGRMLIMKAWNEAFDLRPFRRRENELARIGELAASYGLPVPENQRFKEDEFKTDTKR
jgi:tetratricopeptide (TPR) repeat protein